jgi:hypothetical protein
MEFRAFARFRGDNVNVALMMKTRTYEDYGEDSEVVGSALTARSTPLFLRQILCRSPRTRSALRQALRAPSGR